MHPMHPLHDLARCFRRVECVEHMDAPKHEHSVLELYLANGLTGKPPVTGTDLARLQRAPEGADQSASCRRHDVVDGGGMWVGYVLDAVVGGDGTMRAERHGLRLSRQIGETQRACASHDSNGGAIFDLRHGLVTKG